MAFTTSVVFILATNMTRGVDLQASAVDIESATKLAWRYMLDSGDLLKEEDARQAFINFLELLTASHPLSR